MNNLFGKKIAVVGIGYVGLSLAVLLAQKNNVYALDISEKKVDMVNKKISPIVDSKIQEYLIKKKLSLEATTDSKKVYENAEFVIIATPTNYDADKNYFDTSTVETVIEQVREYNKQAVIVIKSTIPVGYTDEVRKRFDYPNILFSPEFLREGKALEDNLYPSRIIVGYPKGNEYLKEKAEEFAELLKEGAVKKNIPCFFPYLSEAESIKLFSNTYLALRIAFFNELDTFAEIRGMDTKQIIEGVCCDPRIGDYYNNPSFGYGGYCLPKDTKQLRANYKNVPNNLISAIVEANTTRKSFIADQIIRRNPNIVGIYRLTMKKDSDNFRESSIQSIMQKIAEKNIKIVIYEPCLKEPEFQNSKVIYDLEVFKRMSDIIVANRMDDNLLDVKEKVYSRDLYSRD